MDFIVIVMPKGWSEGFAGRLVTGPDESEHKTPFIEVGNDPYYPEDVEWVFGSSKLSRKAAQEAGYKVRNVLGKMRWRGV